MDSKRITAVIIVISLLFISGCIGNIPVTGNTKEIVNNAMGISFSIPVTFNEINSGNTGPDYVTWASKLYFTERLFPTWVSFSDKTIEIEMHSCPFEMDGYEVYVDYSAHLKGEFEELPSLSIFDIIPTVSAMVGPVSYKIDRLDIIDINGNEWHTHSYQVSSRRVDKFIHQRGNVHYIITFVNHSPEEIGKIMDSIEFIQSAHIDFYYHGKTIDNNAINLNNLTIPKDWSYTNTDESTTVFYDGELGKFELVISTESSDEVLWFMKYRISSNKFDPNNPNNIEVDYKEDEKTLKERFGCEKAFTPLRDAYHCTMPAGQDGTITEYGYDSNTKLFTKVSYSGKLGVMRLNYVMILGSLKFPGFSGKKEC